MNFFTGEGGVKTNAGAAACLVPLLEVVLVTYFITSTWPYELFSLVGTTSTAYLRASPATTRRLEVLLDAVHPSGRRQ